MQPAKSTDPAPSTPSSAEVAANAAPGGKSFLLPYQQRWLRDKSQIKICVKSRRIGITWVESMEAAFTAARGHANVYYSSYNRDMAREFIDYVRKWGEHFNEAMEVTGDEPVFDERDGKIFEVRFKSSGKSVRALSSRPLDVRGKDGVFILDEAAYMETLRQYMTAVIAAATVWGKGKVRLISSYNGGPGNHFYDLIEDVRKRPDKHPGYSVHKITFDDALGDGLILRTRPGTPDTPANRAAYRKQIFGVYAGFDPQQELMCIPSENGSAWISVALIEGAQRADCQVIRWRPPAKDFVRWPASDRAAHMSEWFEREAAPALLGLTEPTFCGIDFARKGDQSVFAFCERELGETRRFGAIFEMDDCPYEQQQQFGRDAFTALSERRIFGGASIEAVGNGHALMEHLQQRFGSWMVDGINPTSKWYSENASPLLAYFEDGMIKIPKDRDIATDLRAFTRVNGIPRITDKRRIGEQGEKRHGDAGVAILLAAVASRNGMRISNEPPETGAISPWQRSPASPAGSWHDAGHSTPGAPRARRRPPRIVRCGAAASRRAVRKPRRSMLRTCGITGMLPCA